MNNNIEHLMYYLIYKMYLEMILMYLIFNSPKQSGSLCKLQPSQLIYDKVFNLQNSSGKYDNNSFADDNLIPLICFKYPIDFDKVLLLLL